MNPLIATRNMLMERGRKAVSLYYEIVYALAAPKHVNTMNYGFAPVTENLRQFHPSKDQALQYELYWQTFSQLDDSLDSSEILCEVGCVRGGGLAFLQSSPKQPWWAWSNPGPHAVMRTNISGSM